MNEPTPLANVVPPLTRSAQTSFGARKILSIVVLLAVIILILVAALWYSGKHNATAKPLTGFAVALGHGPARSMYGVDFKTNTFSLLDISDANGTHYFALDALTGAAQEDGYAYYILGAKNAPTKETDLYTKGADGNLVALTHSNTFKYNLSVDTKEGLFAYEATAATSSTAINTTKDWRITIFSQQSKKESVIAAGNNPVLLSGMHTVVYDRNQKLYSFNMQSQKEMQLFDIATGTQYAVDGVRNMLAVQNPITKNIDFFDIVYGSSLSYEKSVPLVKAPDSLSFVNEALIAAYFTPTKEATTTYRFQSVGSLNSAVITAPPTYTYGDVLRTYPYHD
ncbi:MAG: hypothetical protein JWL75_548 [Parcubacteria group bacterium]|nr:hypothetical protein [Parcubacteria group bacterium]